MNEPKVAREVAEQEFDRWIEAMDLVAKIDPSTLDDDDKKSLAAQKNLLLTAIMDGRLVVDGDGQFVFTPKMGGEALTFYEPTGASLMAGDQAKVGAFVQKQFKFMADMTRSTVVRFANMKQRDLSVCLAVTALFLA